MYAVFDVDDDHHEDAKAALEDAEPIAVPSEVLVETVDLVAYRSTAATARSALAWLLARPNVQVAETVHVPAVKQVHAEAGGELSLADAVVVQTCRAFGARPLAFDGAIQDRATA